MLVVSFLLCLLLWTPAFAATKVSLEECLKAGISKNETVLQSEEQVVQLDARISKTRGGVFPKITFNANHTVQQMPDPSFNSFSPQYQTTLKFSATQPLFKGLQEWNALAASEHLYAAQEANKEETETRIAREIATSYYRVLTLEQDRKNLTEQSQIYEKRIKDLSGRARRGESNNTDVVTAEATLASLLAEMRLSDGDLESARENLSYLTGIARDAELTDPNKEVKLGPLQNYLDDVDKRPDVRRAKERHLASDKGVSVAWGAHFPVIEAVGNYYLTRPGFLDQIKWDVGVQATIPLFEGGSTAAGVTEAVSVRRESELELARVRRAAVQEVRSLHGRLAARLEQLKHLQKAAELSRRNTQLLERDYRRGLAKNIDVQLALTEFRNAQKNYDQAHFASQLDLFQLQTATSQVQIK